LTADEDDKLVSLCQKGDTGAFEALVEKHQKKMLNTAYRMIGNYEEACEVVQDAFFSAYKAMGKFRGESRFSTWLYSIVINLSKNRLRRMKTRLYWRGTSTDDPVKSKDAKLPADPPAQDPSPPELMEKKEIQAKVQDCINDLDQEHREVLVLRDVQGFSYEEIGDILRISEGTVKSRLFRAREALKDSLKKAFGGL
jgi:RNA polymerase sigma-70 factor (ECF subfamily)